MLFESQSSRENFSPAPASAVTVSFLQQIIETQNDVIAVELDHSVAMQIVADRTRKMTGADMAAVQLLDGDDLVFRAVSGSASPFLGLRLPVDGSLAGLCSKTGELLYCEDTELDTRVNHSFARRVGARSMILAPLTSTGKTIGLLAIASGKPAAFDQQCILALRLMASLLGAALTHASEFKIKADLLADRTSALAALRESEERFRSAFDHAAIGKALVALDGRWIRVNRSLCKSIGYTETELLATNFQSITHPDDLHTDLAFLHRLIAGEIEDYQMVKRYFHKRGHIVWILLSVSLVSDENRKPLYFISQIQDISQRQKTEDALRNSEEEYRTMFELAGDAKVQTDLATGRFLRANRRFCELTGYSPDEALTLTFDQITHPDDRGISLRSAQQILSGEIDTDTFEKRYVRKDGRIIWVSVTIGAIRDSSGGVSRAVASIQDISRRKQSEWLESDRRKMLEMVIRGAPLPDILVRFTLAIERQIPNALAAFILIAEGNVSLIGCNLPPPLRDLLSERTLARAVDLSSVAWDSPGRCGVSILRSDPLWHDCRETAFQHGLRTCWTFPVESAGSGPYGLLLIFSELIRPPTAAELDSIDTANKLITVCIEHHNATRQLTHLVSHDPLTGLPNRVLFEDRLQQALVSAARHHTSVGYLLLDFDKFKTINDTFGHQVGDRVLQLFAHRAHDQLRKVDTIARVGGDEFAIVLPDLHNPAEAELVAQRIIDAFASPLLVPEHGPVPATVSIGIACAPTHGRDSASLQKHADLALYRVKASGRNNFAS